MDEKRIGIIRVAFFIVGLVFLGRLFYIQIIDVTYKGAAATNALKKIPDNAYRGLIYDRKGRLIVNNQVVFDINIIPRELKKEGMDTLGFCKLVGISKEDYIERLITAKTYSRVRASAFIKQLSQEEAAKIIEHLNEYPGFYAAARTVRAYEFPCMAHAIGYMGEISRGQLDRKEKFGYYQLGDYLGITGLESQYEKELRGKRGTRFVMVDVHGVDKGRFKNGIYDTMAVKGKDLYSTIDVDLQQYGEKLMVNKAGSIVAIETSTGQILAFISAPSYNPALLTGRNFGKNYKALQLDSTKPLFNRAMMAMYPPGSIFKTLQALTAMQMGIIDSNTVFPCNKSIINCHPHPNPCNLKQAIQWSCNPYFVQVYRKIINRGRTNNTFIDTKLGYETWLGYIKSFAIGDRLGIDLPAEQKGILKEVKYFDKVYGPNRWKYSNIYSMSIGQGELGLLPIQMANLACILANGGWYKTPHFARGIGDTNSVPSKFLEVHNTKINRKYYNVIREGMSLAVSNGTVWSAANMKSVEICGKTGTAQTSSGKDHSVFTCFAPKKNPKIALVCFVENAGYGGFVAAPIASLMIEKYLKDTIQRKNLETMMLEKDFMSAYRNKTAR
jgi:penicillin-binding protein 2